jgi:hypothetical protein
MEKALVDDRATRGATTERRKGALRNAGRATAREDTEVS